jgi:hypothetical protein
MNTPANELLGVLGTALESAVVGEGEGTVGEAATAAGVASAIDEGVGVAWAPLAEETSRRPAPPTRTSPMMPNPTKMGLELRLAWVGAWLGPGADL